MMKSRAEVEARIRELVRLEFQRRMARDVLPHLCRHNHRQPLDQRHTIYGDVNESYNRISAGVEDGVSLPVLQTIGLCMLGSKAPETWAGAICEEPLDALRCPVFEHKQSEKDVYDGLVRDLQDWHWLSKHLAEVSSLMWVIDSSTLSITGARPAWWARLWTWFLAGPLREFPKYDSRISVYLPLPPNGPTTDDRARTPLGDGAPQATI